MSLDTKIKNLVLSLREQKQRLDENIQHLRQKKLDKVNFEEQQALETLRKRYADKRATIEKMPINGSLGLQQKIEALEQEIYLLHAERIKNSVKDTVGKDSRTS